MTSRLVTELIPQIQKITGIYRCFNIPLPKNFNYKNNTQDYNESHYKEDVNQIILMKRHPVITQMGFYTHPSNIKK